MRVEIIIIDVLLVTMSLFVLYYFHTMYSYMSHIYQGVAIDKVFKSAIFSYVYITYLMFTLFILPIILIFTGLKLVHIALTMVLSFIILIILGTFANKVTQNYIRHRNKLSVYYEKDDREPMNVKDIQNIESKIDYTGVVSLVLISLFYSIFYFLNKDVIFINLSYTLALILLNTFIFLQIYKIYQYHFDKHFEKLDEILNLNEEEIKFTNERKITMDDIKL